MSIPLSTLSLSPAMQARITAGEVEEREVRQKTAEAFELLWHPILLHYDGKDETRMAQLLKTGLVDVDALCPSPKTERPPLFGLLHLCVLKLKPHILTLLLDHGANPNLSNSEGDPPLHTIAVDDLNSEYPRHKRLHRVEHSMLKDLAERLLIYGANPEQTTTRGGIIKEALEQRGYWLCQLYQQYGADFTAPFPSQHGIIRIGSPYQRMMDTLADGEMGERLAGSTWDDLNQCIARLKHQAKEWKRFRRNPDPQALTTEQAIGFASIGEIEAVFSPEIWRGYEREAITLLSNLPLFIQDKLQRRYTELMLVVSQQTDAQSPDQPDSWSAQIQQEREGKSNEPPRGRG